MTLTPELSNALKIIGGIFWTLTYLIIINRGFKDKSYGMPLFALCANISWEFIFSFVIPSDGVQRIINIVWFGFDLVIVYQYLRFGRSSLKGTMLERYFYPAFAIVLVTCYLGVLTVSFEFQDFNGKYAAFTQNLMMSVLFVPLLLGRNNTDGQSIYAAIFKMVGTLFFSYLFYLRNPASPYMMYLYLATLFFDLGYTVLLYRKFAEARISAWTRKPFSAGSTQAALQGAKGAK
jgi:hypothetical protein